MAFHVRAALVAITAVLLTAGYCAWELSSAAQKHFNEQKISGTTQQLNLTKKQAEEYLDKTANDLTQLIQNEINQPEMTTLFLQSDFIATAVSSSSEGAPWSVDWFRTKNAPLSQVFFDSKLAELNLAEIQNDKIKVSRVEAPDKRVYFTVSVSIRFKTPEGETVKVATGLVPISFFQSLIDATKGSADEGLLVDSSGYAISYPDQQYVGAKIDTHPLVKEALASEQAANVTFGQNIKGEAVVGGFEKLGQSNLILVMSSPVLSRSAAMLQSILQIMLFCLAMVLAVSGILFFWGQQGRTQVELLKSRIQVLEQRQQNPAELSHFVAEQTKKSILREFAFGVVQILRTPMTAVIGQAQLLKENIKDSEQKNTISKIEREVRQSRDFVEQLALSYGLSDIKQQVIEVETLVMPLIGDMQTLLAKHEVQVEENIKTRARVAVPYSDLKQTLRHVLNLMIDRLTIKSGFRSLSINIEQAGPHIFIKLRDNGARPEKEFLAQVFNPFKVSGLNLSLLKSLVESADGQVTAKVSDEGGLEFIIQLLEDKTESVVKKTDSVQVEAVTSAPVERQLVAAPLDLAASFDLPDMPSAENFSIEVKKTIVADEALSVTIRKPKTSFER